MRYGTALNNGVVFNYVRQSGNNGNQYHVEDVHGNPLFVGPTLDNVRTQLGLRMYAEKRGILTLAG